MGSHQAATIKWTWADLISSYRFWGVMFFFILYMLADSIYSTSIYSVLRYDLQLSASMIGTIISLKMVGMLISFIPAWLASRSKSVYPLYVFSGLFLAGLGLIAYGSLPLIHLGVLLIGLSTGAILLLVPAIFASAVASMEVFILSFGLLATVKTIISISSSFIVNLFSSPILNLNSLFIGAAIPLFIAIIILLPAKSCLFSEAPAERTVEPTAPERRAPFITFLLFFIPFYFIFWFARIHRELRTFTQSPALLTPAGAGWSVVLVPFAIPIILSILSDSINNAQQERGNKPGCKTWIIILFALISPPISAALVQSKFNRLTDNLK